MAGVTRSSEGDLGELFSVCDLDGSGYIDETELASFCKDLSASEVSAIFRELDKDGDGRISIAEFSEGFKEFSGQMGAVARETRRRLQSVSVSDDGARRMSVESLDGTGGLSEFLGSADDGFLLLSCQEQVCELYQGIHNAQLPQLLALFESVLLSVIRDIKQHQYENERLERSYKRQKEQHTRHLRQLEEDTESQIARQEARIRKEERERHDIEKGDLRQELETEVAELTANLKKLQKLEGTVTRNPTDELKTRLEELVTENRHLKSSLIDSHTNLALARSEAATSRQQYEEKCFELEREKESLLDYIREQDNLTRQVHLLQDANKKLHDANDDLRSALDTSRSSQKRSYSGNRHSRSRLLRSADFVSDYLDSPLNVHRPAVSGATLADELGMSFDSPERAVLFQSPTSCDVDSLHEDIDSGHSTLRDIPDMDSEYEPNSIDEDVMYPSPRKRTRPQRRSEFGSTTESELPSQDEMDHIDGSEVDSCEHAQESGGGESLRRPVSVSSRVSTCSCGSSGSLKRQITIKHKSPAAVSIPKAITGDPERMYKLVLAGDAAVGKSSFIMRLCKGKFVNNITSTLGVDFQTKVIEVDGRIIALQLWDTAGQERFRSIAKSYFRRADGVLLLYDVTYERSFLNVRDWVESIEDGAQKKIPVMLCGNKTDLRDELSADEMKGKRLVTREDGQRLAKDFEAIFIETSAKQNTNVVEAVTELARILRTNEDIEVKSVGLQLQDLSVSKDKPGIKCCGTL